MTNLFLLQLLLTFLAGSAWIYLTVLAGSRFGSKIGGFIGGLPSTALLSFFFIGLTQSPAIASRATTVFPLAIGISGMFLVVYAWLSKKSYSVGMSAALAAWFILSSLIVLLHPGSFGWNLVIYLLIMACAYYLLEKRILIRSVSDPKAGHTSQTLVLRALFGGLAIVMTVLVAKLGGPVIGGIFAAFPAMFMATLTITYRVNGIEFSRAMTKPLLVTGMITVAVYAIALRYLYPPVGLYLGTLLSIVAAGISAYLTLIFILPRLT